MTTNEQLPDVFYHGTSVSNLFSILATGSITSGNEDGGPLGVSLADQWDVAAGYAQIKQEIDVENAFPEDYDHVPEGDCDGAVLVLDTRRMIDAGYRIAPFQWVEDNGTIDEDDTEWRLEGDLGDILRYVTDIHVTLKDIDWHIELYGAAPVGSEEFVRILHQAMETVGCKPAAEFEEHSARVDFVVPQAPTATL
jgi:hypothetical protein